MDLKKTVLSQFGKNAEEYVKSKGHAKGNDLAKMISIFEENKEATMLDIATGGGHVANTFAPFVKNVIALDLTPEMLKTAEKFLTGNGHLNIHYVVGDAESLPFDDNSFDIVMCRIAAHHFPDIDAFVKEAYRVLKKGGYFYLNDNVAPESEDLDIFFNTIEKRRDISHFRAWKKTEWIKLLEETGFSIEMMLKHEKPFNFEDWSNRMKMSEQDKKQLNDMITQSSGKIIKHFNIKIENEQVISFHGEAAILKAKKN